MLGYFQRHTAIPPGMDDWFDYAEADNGRSLSSLTVDGRHRHSRA